LKRQLCSLVLLLLFGSVIFAEVPVLALETSSLEAEGVTVHVPYTGIVVGRKEKAEMDITFKNDSDREAVLEVGLEGLDKEKWDARLVSDKWRGHGVSRVMLGKDDPFDRVKATLILEPLETTPPGEYEFSLVVKHETGEKAMVIPITLDLVAEEIAPVEEVLALECSYPVVENPAGKNFTYEVGLKNQGQEDIVVDLKLSLPAGWSGHVTPRWESDRKIQSLKVGSGSTERLNITAIPPLRVEKSRYPLTFIAVSGEEQAQLELEAVVTGTYNLKLMPETQRLSFETIAGKEKTLVLYLWNEGTAGVENIEIYSSKPEGWEVSFEPDKVQALDAYSVKGKPDQIKMTIKAPDRTIPGDYQVTVTAAGDQSQDTIVLRATVKVPTTWGWVGIGIIVAVLVLLFGIFWKLKRR